MIAPQSFIDLLKGSGITCDAVISAMVNIDRTSFVETALHQYAWLDQTLPIGNEQTISLPSVVAKMTQSLELKKSDKVLEIGTGCGYQTSILSKLAGQIYTVERHPSLSKMAKQRFDNMKIYNVITMVDDGGHGFKNQAPFDKIILTCSAIDIPTDLTEQLKLGGIMIVPVGEQGEEQDLLKITKLEDGIDIEELGKVDFVPMLEGLGF
ncbi:MAG: protein-L-isoaspartate(D-aspartate) O-methyltransferase [Alphaproteobacteria bacterium]